MKKSYIIAIIILISFLLFLVTNLYQRHMTVFEKNSFRAFEVKDEMTLITYNMQHSKKLDLISNVFSDNKANIIALNEVDSNLLRSSFFKQYKYLADILEMNYSFGPTLKKGFGYYGNAILTVYPIKKSINHLLPKGERIEQRALLEVIVNIPNIGESSIFVTHLSLNQEHREKEIKWIENYIENINRPFVLMGDLNCELDVLAGYKGFNDELVTYPTRSSTMKIDNIFSDFIANLDYEVSTLDLEVSDHLPLMIKVNLG